MSTAPRSASTISRASARSTPPRTSAWWRVSRGATTVSVTAGGAAAVAGGSGIPGDAPGSMIGVT